MTHHGHLVKSRLTIKHHQYVSDSLLITSVNTKVKKLHSVCYIIRFWLCFYALKHLNHSVSAAVVISTCSVSGSAVHLFKDS